MFVLTLPLYSQVIDQPWSTHIIDSSLFGADGVKHYTDGSKHVLTVGWEQSGKTRAYVFNNTMQLQHYVEVSTPGVEDAFVCDFNNDGNLDIISFLDEGGTNISLFYAKDDLISNSATTFTLKVIAASFGSQWMYGEMMDVNEDGYLDIVGGSKKTGARLSVFINPLNSSGTWVEKKIDDAGWIMSIKLIDMDGDGDKDILVSDRDCTPKGVKWYKNPGAANHTDTWTKQVIGLTAASHNPMFLNVYDDDDGQIKILATSLTEGVYLFEENTSYTEDKLFAIPSACGEWMKDVAYHDLDNDGTVEIVYSLNNAYGTHGVNYAILDGNGSYIHHAISGIQSPKYDNLLFIDMDGDGDDDILTTEENDNNNTVKGLGFIWFENPIINKK